MPGSSELNFCWRQILSVPQQIFDFLFSLEEIRMFIKIDKWLMNCACNMISWKISGHLSILSMYCLNETKKQSNYLCLLMLKLFGMFDILIIIHRFDAVKVHG